MEPYFQIWC
jgi:hypothetical protein